MCVWVYVPVACVTDEMPGIRLAVLHALDTRLDKYLGQTELLDTLFLLLNDEVFQIRDLAISVLGRLSNRNPAVVMPFLRKVLIQLLLELKQFNEDTLDLERSCVLLRRLISSAAKLVKPYVGPILLVLEPKLRSVEVSGNNSGGNHPNNPDNPDNPDSPDKPKLSRNSNLLTLIND